MVLGVADGVRTRLGRPPAGGTDLGRLCREPFPTRAERQRQTRRRPPASSPTSACRSPSASLVHVLERRRPVHPVALGRTSGRPRPGRREPVWMSSRAPPRSPTGRRSALAHLRQQDRRHGRRLGDDRDRGRSASSIGVPRHFVLPSPAARSPPWRPTGRRSRSTGRRASSIGGPRRPTSCCRGGDRDLERYCSQKEKAHSFLLSVRLGGHVQHEYPSGRPENPRPIIPFVNRSLTSGLPIGSPSSTIHVCLMDKALWVSVIIIRRGVA